MADVTVLNLQAHSMERDTQYSNDLLYQHNHSVLSVQPVPVQGLSLQRFKFYLSLWY